MPHGTPLVLEVHTMGDPDTGVWCDRCLLPSALRISFVMVHRSTLSAGPRMSVEVCPECGELRR